MNLLQTFKMALRSVLTNKVRSFLTMLGVIIGVSAVIASVAFAEGSTKKTKDQLQSLGSNLIMVNITGRNSNRTVDYNDLLKFQQANSKMIANIAPQTTAKITAKVGTKTRDTTVTGTSPEYQNVQNRTVETGRFLASTDLDFNQKVAIIGTAVANDLFSGTSPIGKTIKIYGQPFKVVGVMTAIEQGQDGSKDDMIIIPVTVGQRVAKSSTIGTFTIQATSEEYVNTVVDNVNTFLYGVFKDTSSYRVTNMAQIISTLDSITGIMMVVLGGIATISLVVGGIGIMNIMLVSVTERTREIGIRKAIGAKKKNILKQFLIEALMVTGIGGIIGVLFGLFLIKFAISKFVPAVYSVTWISISFGISLVVGVVFGIFPAYKAANLNPIDALAQE